MHATAVNLRLALRNLLFTTDFSEPSQVALPYVLALAQWYGAKVFILHSVPPEPPLPIPMEPLPLSLDVSWQHAQRHMQEFLLKNSFPGIEYESLLQQGEFWDVVSAAIRDHSIDMIVLGSHGRTGVKKIVLGSMAEQVFRRASCPVLTIGPHVATRPRALDTWKHILFATDFSPASTNALPYALSLAEENQADLSLLHMVPLVPLQQQDQVQKGLQKRLESLVPPDALAWCKPHYEVRFDFAVDGILAAAAEIRADIIVLGVHTPRAPWAASHLPWATAYEVVCHAPCPVLTVRG
ncbi:MAG TPA: universal stress protein [Terriglobales bacterium]|nr:universal stress protein [Terriglobales bacterium]